MDKNQNKEAQLRTTMFALIGIFSAAYLIFGGQQHVKQSNAVTKDFPRTGVSAEPLRPLRMPATVHKYGLLR